MAWPGRKAAKRCPARQRASRTHPLRLFRDPRQQNQMQRFDVLAPPRFVPRVGQVHADGHLDGLGHRRRGESKDPATMAAASNFHGILSNMRCLPCAIGPRLFHPAGPGRARMPAQARLRPGFSGGTLQVPLPGAAASFPCQAHSVSAGTHAPLGAAHAIQLFQDLLGVDVKSEFLQACHHPDGFAARAERELLHPQGRCVNAKLPAHALHAGVFFSSARAMPQSSPTSDSMTGMRSMTWGAAPAPARQELLESLSSASSAAVRVTSLPASHSGSAR